MNHGKFPKQEDSYAFEEDSSSESLSPEQPLSDESQSSAGPLAEPKASVASPSLTSPAQVSRHTNPAAVAAAVSALNKLHSY